MLMWNTEQSSGTYRRISWITEVHTFDLNWKDEIWWIMRTLVSIFTYFLFYLICSCELTVRGFSRLLWSMLSLFSLTLKWTFMAALKHLKADWPQQSCWGGKCKQSTVRQCSDKISNWKSVNHWFIFTFHQF